PEPTAPLTIEPTPMGKTRFALPATSRKNVATASRPASGFARPMMRRTVSENGGRFFFSFSSGFIVSRAVTTSARAALSAVKKCRVAVPIMSTAAEVPLLGRIALHYKMITAEQLQQALERQARTSDPKKKLGEALLEMGLITQEQLDWLLNAQAQMAKKAQA